MQLQNRITKTSTKIALGRLKELFPEKEGYDKVACLPKTFHLGMDE